MSDSLWPQEPQPTTLPCPWNSPGKTTGVGCHRLLKGSSWLRDHTRVSLHWQADSLPLSHQGSPQSPQSNMTSENNSPPTQILSANGKELACTQPSNEASNLSKTKNAKKYIFWNGENLDLELCGFYISHHWILHRAMLLCKGKYKKEAPTTGTQPSGNPNLII